MAGEEEEERKNVHRRNRTSRRVKFHYMFDWHSIRTRSAKTKHLTNTRLTLFMVVLHS